jgi:MYXO-CTERM domain-containing protein
MRLLVRMLVVISCAALSTPAIATTVTIEATGYVSHFSFGDTNAYGTADPDGLWGAVQPDPAVAVNNAYLDGFDRIDALRSGTGSLTLTQAASNTAFSPYTVTGCSGFFAHACGANADLVMLSATSAGGPTTTVVGYNLWHAGTSSGSLLPTIYSFTTDAADTWQNGLGTFGYMDLTLGVTLTSFSTATAAPIPTPNPAPVPLPLPAAFLLTGLMAFALLRRRRFTVSS